MSGGSTSDPLSPPADDNDDDDDDDEEDEDVEGEDEVRGMLKYCINSSFTGSRVVREGAFSERRRFDDEDARDGDGNDASIHRRAYSIPFPFCRSKMGCVDMTPFHIPL
jgi:hypothetical protein